MSKTAQNLAQRLDAFQPATNNNDREVFTGLGQFAQSLTDLHAISNRLEGLGEFFNSANAKRVIDAAGSDDAGIKSKTRARCGADSSPGGIYADDAILDKLMTRSLKNTFPGQAQQRRGFYTGKQLVNIGQEFEVRGRVYYRYRKPRGQIRGASQAGKIAADDYNFLPFSLQWNGILCSSCERQGVMKWPADRPVSRVALLYNIKRLN